MRIVEAILRNQNTVLSVSSPVYDYSGINDGCLSFPTIVNRGGIERVLWLELNAEEQEGLRRSAAVLKDVIARLELP